MAGVISYKGRLVRMAETPHTIDQLDERAKERAHSDYLQHGLDWDCTLQDGYADDAHFKARAAERGIEIEQWHWSVGNYNGTDFVSFEAKVDKTVWVQWRIQQIEEACVGPWRDESKRPSIPDWLFALETMVLSGMLDTDEWCIAVRGRDDGCMYADITDYGKDSDEVADAGMLAGARYEELEKIVCGGVGQDGSWEEIERLLRLDAEEIADEALASLQADCEWRTSMEYFEEMCEANEWKFDEDGRWLS